MKKILLAMVFMFILSSCNSIWSTENIQNTDVDIKDERQFSEASNVWGWEWNWNGWNIHR